MNPCWLMIFLLGSILTILNSFFHEESIFLLLFSFLFMSFLKSNLIIEIFLIKTFFVLFPYQKLLFIIIYLCLLSFAFHYEFENLDYLNRFFVFKFVLRATQFMFLIIVSFQDFLSLSKKLFLFHIQALSLNYWLIFASLSKERDLYHNDDQNWISLEGTIFSGLPDLLFYFVLSTLLHHHPNPIYFAFLHRKASILFFEILSHIILLKDVQYELEAILQGWCSFLNSNLYILQLCYKYIKFKYSKIIVWFKENIKINNY